MRKLALVLAIIASLAVAGLIAYRAGWVRFNHPGATAHPVRGIDVSHHQGPIDWPAVAASGIRFAYIKSTEGETLADPRFTANWQGARAAGVPWAPYHFFTFCTPGTRQAAHFAAVAAGLPRNLPPAVDVEFVGNCKGWTSLRTVNAELAHFLEQVERDFGDRPILYVTVRAEVEVLGPAFPGHPRWARSIFGAPDTSVFGRWTFWQFADNARLPGVTGPVDLNVYCCPAADFPVAPIR